jgi:hypothetical protein
MAPHYSEPWPFSTEWVNMNIDILVQIQQQEVKYEKKSIMMG